jgi:hypothetical protein
MRWIGFIVVAACFTLLAGCDQISQRYQEHETKGNAKARVTTILEGIKKAGRRSDQKALCLWYDGSIYINDEHEQSFASDNFDRWRQTGGIGGGIQTFEVAEVVVEPAEEVPTALVSGTIDGKPFSMRVPEGKMIAWVTKPKGSSRWD